VHGAQDSSSFITLHEHSKVFQIMYTNCRGNVFSGKVIVQETSVTHKIYQFFYTQIQTQTTVQQKFSTNTWLIYDPTVETTLL